MMGHYLQSVLMDIEVIGGIVNHHQNLKKMHLAVTEELTLPEPDEVKTLMNKMDQLLKLIESK